MKIFLALATLATLILFSLLAQISLAQADNTRPQPPARVAQVPQATADVTIVDFAFQPATITIYASDTVTWTYPSGIAHHTTTSDTGLWDSGSLFPGQGYLHTFTTTGYFPYHCNVHASMHGVVRVIAPSFIPLLTNFF